MGHISDERLFVLRTQFPFITANKTHVCDTCHRANQKKLSFNLSSSRTNFCFELLHMDIWGPCSVSSMYGHKYFLTIVDDFSRFTWLIPMVTKFETRIHIENFIAYVKNQFESSVKIICTDKEVEFTKKFFSLLKVLFIKLLVLRHLNKTILLKENTNIS